MSLTRTQAEALIRQFADDPQSKHWSDANLRLLAGIVIDGLWGELLGFQPRLTTALDTVTVLTTPGYVDTAAGEDLTQRFFKVQSIVRDGAEYAEVDPRNVLIEDNEAKVSEGSFNGRWFQRGEEVHLLPYELTPEVEFRYSYLPESFNTLEAGDTVTWVDGYELAYVYAVAAHMMSKGGYEDKGSAEMFAKSEREMGRLREKIEKLGPGPMMPFHADHPQQYGSE